MSRWRPGPTPVMVGLNPRGWLAQVDRTWTDGRYAVLVRTVRTEWGDVEHVIIRNRAGSDIPWREKQRIKDELFGRDRVAVEVFPAEADLVDAAPLYRLWVLPRGFRLPFGLRSTGEAQEEGEDDAHHD